MRSEIESKQEGFTLIEILIALTLFITIGYAIYAVVDSSFEVIARNQWRIQVVSILDKEIETIHNLDYSDVGVIGGAPSGVLEAEKTVTFKGVDFKVYTTVRNIDDPFDGTQGGAPNDTAPADYKLVELEAECISCQVAFNPIKISTTIAPKNLETATNNGSLFVNVFDASGLPISGANVLVDNQIVTPTVTISDETNTSGVLQLIDIPTSTQGYAVTVSKSGYSSSKTYEPGLPANPNPDKPHSTVASQAITSISFAIDKVSALNLQTSNEFCSGVGNVDFYMQGAKLVGTAPDVYKYAKSLATDSQGSSSINNIEWDSYTLSNTDIAYDLAGESILSPITVNPDETINLRWLMIPSNPSALQVIVKDDNGNLVDDASVRLEGASTDLTQFSGVRSLIETDWSGGNYSAKDSQVEADSPSGQVSLVSTGGKYSTTTTHTLTSNTFDIGSTSTVYKSLSWNPESQPAQTGSNSLKFQIATNNNNSTWNYLGPDGTGASYYTNASSTIYGGHTGDRYLRYKVFLSTENESYTPTLEDIKFNFSSSCIPAGQTFFNGLSTGTYTITINKAGFQSYTDSAVSVSSNSQKYEATLTP